MSSAIASASKNTLMLAGIRRLSSARTPTANAMSVAMGMPQPSAPSDPPAMARKITAGVIMPPERRGRRQQGSARRRQLAMHQLALDLQPGEEEEQRHQAVVHPLLQVQVDLEDVRVNRDVGVPQLGVGVAPGRVRPHQRDDGRQ